MRGCRPHDRQAIPARHDEETLPGRRGAIVGGDEFAPLDLIAERLQLPDPDPEREPDAIRARPVVLKKRPPFLELLDVLKDDDAWPHCFSPAHHDPCEAPDR